MPIILLLGLGIIVVATVAKESVTTQDLHPVKLSAKHLLRLRQIKVFADGIRKGLTVSKADVQRFYKLALQYSSPELPVLTLVLMQLNDSGMGMYQQKK